MKKLILIALAAGLCAAQSERWMLYRASIAAADGALRLHETSPARHWLEAAPAEHRGWEWRYLRGLADQSSGAVKAHDAPVTGLALDGAGELAATTAGDGSVRLWRVKDRTAAGGLPGHSRSAWSPAFRGRERQLATMGSDGSVRVWSTDRLAEVRRYEKLGRGLGAVAWSPDGRLLAAAAWTVEPGRGVVGWIYLWDFDADKLLWKAEYGVKPIPSLAFHPDGEEFAVGTWDGWVGVFPVAGGGKPRVEARLNMEGGYAAIQRVAYAGNALLVASKDSMLREFDGRTGREVRTYGGHSRWVNGASAHEGWAASGSSDETIRLWDRASGTTRRVLHGHTSSVNALEVTPDGRQLLSADAAGNLLWWDAGLADLSAVEWRSEGDVYGLAFSPDGRKAATGAWGGKITMRDVGTGRVLWAEQTHRQSANAIAFSRDGTRMVSGGNDGRLQLSEAATGKVMATWEAIDDGRAAVIAWSPDGRRVFCPSSRPGGKIWDASSGEMVRTVAGGSGEIYAAAFSPDSRRLLVGWTGGELALLEVESGGRTTPAGWSGAVHAVAFHPAGTQYAAAGSDRRIRVWDAATGKLVRTMEGHGELIYSLDYSPDGKRLVSASTDQTVRLWDTASGDEVLRIPFASQVYAARFSPDGRTVAVAPMDGRVVLLNAP